MKRFNRRSASVLLAVVMMLAVTAGTAWAYFTDYDELSGAVALKLENQTEIEEQTTEKTKTVSIKNTGEADVIVKVMLYGPKEMTVTGSNDWQITDNGDGSFTAYYKSILEVGQSTSEMLASIENIPVTVENTDVEIIVMQECRVVEFDENNTVIAPDDWAGFPVITVE
jgi:predicted ribosomally synthesized peptide with SipW-like signal peptide